MSDENLKLHEGGSGGGGHGGGGHRGGGHGGGGHGGGGGHEEHEGAPEWLISFADNVALMMGFFVILLAMKMNLKSAELAQAAPASGGDPDASSGALIDMAIAIREAFNNPVDPLSEDPRDAALVQRIRGRMRDGPALSAGTKGFEREVQTIRRSQYRGLGAKLTFETDSTAIGEQRATLRQLADALRGSQAIVQVRGHVSALEAYHSGDRGQELSYRRAVAVAAALVDIGLRWDQLRVEACGFSDHVAKRVYDPAGHAQNQRVEVIVTDELAETDDEPAEPASETAPESGHTPTRGPAAPPDRSPQDEPAASGSPVGADHPVAPPPERLGPH